MAKNTEWLFHIKLIIQITLILVKEVKNVWFELPLIRNFGFVYNRKT
jgi:hypothetical protein